MDIDSYIIILESLIIINDKLKEVKKLNSSLNKWSYGVFINGKIITKPSEVDWNEFKTHPIDIMEKYHVGICWDFVNYQHSWFKKNNIKDNSYLFVMQLSENPNDIVTHSFSIIQIDSKRYWFESSWQSHQGLHEVNSFKDVIKLLVDRYDKNRCRAYSVFKYNPDGMDKSLSNKQFFDKATRICVLDVKANIVANESGLKSNIAKDFKSKGNLSLSSFKKERITQNLVDKLSSDYKYLKHLRISDSTEGYFFLKGNVIVATIMVEIKSNNEKWIQALEINRQYQGYGLGKQLLLFARDTLKAYYLSVYKDNHVAINLYKKNGYMIYDSTRYMYFMKYL